MSKNLKPVLYASIEMTSVFWPGPPWVSRKIRSNSRKASMPRIVSAIRISGVRSGIVMCRRVCQPLAPSIAAASSDSCGSDWSPASRIKNMNGVARQTSTTIRASIAVEGLAR